MFSIVLCNAVQCSAVEWSAMHNIIIQCSAGQCSTVHCTHKCTAECKYVNGNVRHDKSTISKPTCKI